MNKSKIFLELSDIEAEIILLERSPIRSPRLTILKSRADELKKQLNLF